MPGIDENQKIQKITDLLVKGGTMLANHHDCGAPMFRYKGKIICPVCDIGITGNTGISGKVNTGITGMSGKEEAIPIIRAENEKAGKKSAPVQSYLEMENHILNKVHVLAETIEDETDLQRLRDKMECIELGIRILKALKN